jgi:hypothetical protein
MKYPTLGATADKALAEARHYWPTAPSSPAKHRERAAHLGRITTSIREARDSAGRRLVEVDPGYLAEYRALLREMIPGRDVQHVDFVAPPEPKGLAAAIAAPARNEE